MHSKVSECQLQWRTLVIEFLQATRRIPVADNQRHTFRTVIPINWRRMERMAFLLPILQKHTVSLSHMEATEQQDDEEPTESTPPTAADSELREKRMKTAIRIALRGYKYKKLLKVLERYRLKFVKHLPCDTRCEVIELFEADLAQCIPSVRSRFLKWYGSALRRRIDSAVINEKLNYRIYWNSVLLHSSISFFPKFSLNEMSFEPSKIIEKKKTENNN